MKHIFIVMTAGYWGKGETIFEAAQNCLNEGSRRTEPSLCRMILSPTDSPDVGEQVTVNVAGEIEYPQTCEVIPLSSPKNSRIKLGSLIAKS